MDPLGKLLSIQEARVGFSLHLIGYVGCQRICVIWRNVLFWIPCYYANMAPFHLSDDEGSVLIMVSMFWWWRQRWKFHLCLHRLMMKSDFFFSHPFLFQGSGRRVVWQNSWERQLHREGCQWSYQTNPFSCWLFTWPRNCP